MLKVLLNISSFASIEVLRTTVSKSGVLERLFGGEKMCIFMNQKREREDLAVD